MIKDKDFKVIYSMFDAPVCNFDCGAVCSLKNEGIPVCCEHNVVIPVLHRTELDYVKKHSKLWSEFVPKTKADHKLTNSCCWNEVLAVCGGHLKCDRQYRGLVCRTFPFYPYIEEKKARFAGLTYNYDFEGKCLLVGKPKLVNRRYVDAFMRAWSYIFDLDDEEFEAQFAMSRDIEENRKKKSKPVHIISMDGLRVL